MSEFINQETAPVKCIRCGGLCDPADNFCRRCGRALKPGRGFIHSHAGILVLALVLGPFALPAVWTSQRISTASKWIYTLVLGIIGYYLIVACWHIYQLSMQSMQLLMGSGF